MIKKYNKLSAKNSRRGFEKYKYKQFLDKQSAKAKAKQDQERAFNLEKLERLR